LTCNIYALLFCFVLYLKAKYAPSSADANVSENFKNFFSEYFWGAELYPSIGGVQIKQLCNSRFGMINWQILPIVYCCKQYQLYGHLSSSMFVSVFLQTAYIFKFFCWETGYFSTIDMMHDNAGFVLIWGVTVWISSLYTITTMYLTERPIEIPLFYSALLIVLGLLFLYINYEADLQKQITRKMNGENKIWGRKPNILRANYKTSDGNIRESILLVDGYWKISRHFHYLPELLLVVCWTLPAGFDSLVPWFYFIQLTLLLVDRTRRDEIRCKLKYAETFNQYCKLVPYKIVPYLY